MFFPQQVTFSTTSSLFHKWLFRNICHGILLVPPIWISQALINLCFSHFRDVYEKYHSQSFWILLLFPYQRASIPWRRIRPHLQDLNGCWEIWKSKENWKSGKKKKVSVHWVLLSVEPRFKIDSVGFCKDHHFAGRKWLENTYTSFGTLK